MATNTVKLTFKYTDDTTRQYALGCADSLLTGVKNKVKAINTSLAGGTSGGLNSFFVSIGGASFASISAAQIISETETTLDLSGGN